jgi:hypothetical protein
MSTRNDESNVKPVQLTDDDVAYLLSVLRDPSRSQPLTTQALIDALRARAGK